MTDLSKALDTVETGLISIEEELNYLAISGQYSETVSEFSRATGLLKQLQRIHEVWLVALESA